MKNVLAHTPSYPFKLNQGAQALKCIKLSLFKGYNRGVLRFFCTKLPFKWTDWSKNRALRKKKISRLRWGLYFITKQDNVLYLWWWVLVKMYTYALPTPPWYLLMGWIEPIHRQGTSGCFKYLLLTDITCVPVIIKIQKVNWVGYQLGIGIYRVDIPNMEFSGNLNAKGKCVTLYPGPSITQGHIRGVVLECRWHLGRAWLPGWSILHNTNPSPQGTKPWEQPTRLCWLNLHNLWCFMTQKGSTSCKKAVRTERPQG